MKKKFFAIATVMLLGLVGLSACGGNSKTSKSDTSTTDEVTTAEKIKVTDSNGEVEVPLNPKKSSGL